jgi:membrane protease YdiL (CAAX protease family)
MEQTYRSSSSHMVAWTLGFVAALSGAWIGAWILEQMVEPSLEWLRTDGGQFAYWTLMKLLLWVLPAVALIHLSGRQVREVIAVKRWRAAILWGGGVGLLLAAVALLTKALGHQPLFAPEPGWGFVNAVLVAPIVEEFTFRGAVFGSLAQRYRFSVANTLTALFFLGAHLIGWYFQGRLISLLTAPLGGALSIFLLGWLFGWVLRQSQSLIGSTLTHILNNLFS